MKTPPALDPRFRFEGVSFLRRLNKAQLKKLKDGVVVIQQSGERLAVVMSFETYRAMEAK